MSEMKPLIQNESEQALVTTFLRALLVGLLLSEAFYLGFIAGNSIHRYTVNGEASTAYLTSLFFIAFCGLVFPRKRDWKNKLKYYSNRNRVDLLFALFVGVFISVLSEGLGSALYNSIVNLIPEKLLLFAPFAPSIFVFFVLINRKTKKQLPSNSSKKSRFLNDNEIVLSEEDCFEVVDKANDFAEQVYNEGARDSIVFGVDSPWGAGKTSFLHLCEEAWKENYKEGVVVYKFSPLQYETESNLLDVFIDGLVAKIKSEVFSPEIRTSMGRYSKFFRGRKTLGIPGLSVDLSDPMYTIKQHLFCNF